MTDGHHAKKRKELRVSSQQQDSEGSIPLEDSPYQWLIKPQDPTEVVI